MSERFLFDYSSPIGILEISGTARNIDQIKFSAKTSPANKSLKNPELLSETIRQLNAYFRGDLKKFILPLSPSGSIFQKMVWTALRSVPYGSTATYGEIAKNIENPKASRAVGGANNKNPIPIVIPCHRIIGATGSLVGYAGELWRKKWLLHHEKNILHN
jgi:methylated-DNA-[protein]-cysteine S-methyltransferase